MDVQTTVIDARQSRQALLAGSVGNFIEWYEFGVYGFLATVIAANFFTLQGESEITSLILTYAAFALAFFCRPIGAVIFGRIGDRIGRRPTLIAVLLLMTLATALIGVMPTYAAIGVAAPLLLTLTLLRMFQGLFAGGEFGGAVSLMTEFAPKGKRGLYGAWQSLTVAFGLLAGAGLVALLAALLTPEQLHDWGWRIPFLLALPMGAVALWLRLKLQETPTFKQAQQDGGETAQVPEVKLGGMLKTILIGIGRMMGWSAAGYTFLVVMPSYLQTSLHATFQQALVATVLANVGFALTILPAGILSDKLGRKTVMLAAVIAVILFTFPLLHLLQDPQSSLLTKGIAVLIAGAVVGMLAGPGPAMLAEMFPTKVRYTGLGLAYSLSNAVFSGSAGLIITGLIKQTGNLDIPAYYVVATSVVSLFALMTLRRDDHLRSLNAR
ncbi:MHS family MFS transporter [Serratia plymuthica]|uniref:MFS transporter n=1 Tax=Serratia plymuthica TaxID=82996 RepID=UPI001F20BF20|nr:MFS transporter [Serratia plymuthica]UJD98983.1 MHS family MFS transporter [Serratia plymuthica]